MRNKIAECLLIRDENHLLLEHLICNAIAGVERVHNNTMNNKRMVYLTADTYPQCVLHHYRFRSFEDYIVKMQRGTCLAESWGHSIKDFFELHKNIRPDHPEVVSLMQRYGVDVNYVQKYQN